MVKQLQIQNNWLNALLRAPIKLKDIETFVEDYMLVRNETRGLMAEPKKKDLEDPINAKIQRKFDLVFARPLASSEEPKSTVFNEGQEDYFESDLNLDGDMSMSNNAQKKPETQGISPSLELDLDMETTGTNIEFSGPEAVLTNSAESSSTNEAVKLAVVPDDSALEFDLNFGDDTPAARSLQNTTDLELKKETTTKSESHFELELGSDGDVGFELEMSEASGPKKVEAEAAVAVAEDFAIDDMDSMFDEAIADAKNHMASEGTQKTIIYDKSQLASEGFGGLDLDANDAANSTADLMSTEEAKANIDATIKGILRPKQFESTQEIDISDIGDSDDFKGYDSEEILTSDTLSAIGADASTGVFDLSSIEFADEDSAEDILPKSPAKSFRPELESMPESTPVVTSNGNTSYVSDEESSRFQGTIRQLREEREDLMTQIKKFKGENRELEQDNLTLKAALDESKIEVSILRKRHMVELEDVKYRLSVNEEKKAMAIEQARLADSKREKLEQRVRIDFNQVKQREKELETKLEMLSIDVDSQVQSRDQKILELRRKIDALEFNMENVSIKEQKSHDDKRKLEDKLSKIMKTLRHSIKNLEDDIDQASDETQEGRMSDSHRSNKTLKYE